MNLTSGAAEYKGCAICAHRLRAHAGGLAACPAYEYRVFQGVGADVHSLQGIVDEFTAALGGENNGGGAAMQEGFRQIVWDADRVPFDMPADFFEVDIPLGAVFVTDGDEFRVSNTPETAHPADDRFDSIVGHDIASRFMAFSPDRLFAPLKSNTMSTVFTVPGKPGVEATTSGFGAVFTDVDAEHETKMKFMDKHGCHIAEVYVPAQAKGLSFAGITAWTQGKWQPEPVIAEVEKVLGDVALAHAQQGHGDVVVMDNFIYGEPQPMH